MGSHIFTKLKYAYVSYHFTMKFYCHKKAIQYNSEYLLSLKYIHNKDLIDNTAEQRFCLMLHGMRLTAIKERSI